MSWNQRILDIEHNREQEREDQRRRDKYWRLKDKVVFEEMEPVNSMVESPVHYQVIPEKEVEAKHIIRAQLEKLYGPDAYRAYCHGNMLKYLLRQKWDQDEDIRKTGQYGKMYTGEDE